MSDRLGERPPAFSDGEVIDLREKLQTQLDYLDRVLGNAPPLPTLRVANPAEWEGKKAPARRWDVPDYIPHGTVALLYADGGTGKGYLGLQLAVGRALAKEWIGLIPEPGRTLVLSTEDDTDEMWRRIEGMLPFYGTRMGDLRDIRLVDLVGENSVLGLLDRGIILPTPMYQALDAYTAQFKPGMVILDVLADLFSGEENSRPQVTQFIGLLKGLCRKHDCTVLLSAQPSLTGMNTGTGTSGSTGWSNSSRAGMYFQRVKTSDGEELNKDLRTFEGMKNNYGVRGGKFDLVFEKGIFRCVTGPAGFDKMAADRKIEDAYLATLKRRNSQKRTVSDKPGANYAPAVFAKEPEAIAAGITSKQFEASMARLFAAGKIRVEISGPPSRQTRSIVIVEDQ
jgi:RecA-family ATPase